MKSRVMQTSFGLMEAVGASVAERDPLKSRVHKCTKLAGLLLFALGLYLMLVTPVPGTHFHRLVRQSYVASTQHSTSEFENLKGRVQHAMIAGYIEKDFSKEPRFKGIFGEKHTFHGVLHIYYRMLKYDNETYLFRGFTVWECSDFTEELRAYGRPKKLDYHTSSWPYHPGQLPLGIQEDDGDIIPVSFTYGRFSQVPYFHLRIRIKDRVRYAFVVNTWPRQYNIDIDPEIIPPYIPATSGERRIIQVIPPPHGLAKNMSLLMSVLKHTIDYNHQVGINAMCLYCREPVCSAVRGHAEYAELEDRLIVFPFHFDVIDSYTYYDQLVIYNHALLTFWGSQFYLFIADFDEFFATPEKVNLQVLMESGCLSSGCTVLPRYTVYANLDQPDEELRNAKMTWMDILAERSGNPIQSLKSRDEKTWLYKMLINPMEVTGIDVHYADQCIARDENMTCTKTAGCAYANTSCAYVSHYMNMFVGRKPPELLLKDDSWLWMYRK